MRTDRDRNTQPPTHVAQNNCIELKHTFQQATIAQFLFLADIHTPCPGIHKDAHGSESSRNFALWRSPIPRRMQTLRHKAAEHFLHTINVESSQKTLSNALHTPLLWRTHSRNRSRHLLSHECRQANGLFIPKPRVMISLLTLPPPTIVSNGFQSFQQAVGGFCIKPRPQVRRTKPILPQRRRSFGPQAHLETASRTEVCLVLCLLERLPLGKIIVENQVSNMLHTSHSHKSNARLLRMRLRESDAYARQSHPLRLPMRQRPRQSQRELPALHLLV